MPKEQLGHLKKQQNDEQIRFLPGRTISFDPIVFPLWPVSVLIS